MDAQRTIPFVKLGLQGFDAVGHYLQSLGAVTVAIWIMQLSICVSGVASAPHNIAQFRKGLFHKIITHQSIPLCLHGRRRGPHVLKKGVIIL
jgi:hypothetical protein